jgi:proliferating cell nuclear antigen
LAIKSKFKEASTWKTMIEALFSVVPDIYFSADESGLHARAIDEAHIAMVDLNIPDAAFETYECTAELKFGVSLAEMIQIMRRSGGTESLELSVDAAKVPAPKETEEMQLQEEEYRIKGKLKLKLKSANSTRNFSLSLLGATGEDEIPIPRIEFNTSLVISAGIFKDAIKDAEIVGDYIILETTPDTLKMKAEGDTGDVEVIINKDTLYKFDVKEDSKAIYALKYLSDMTKAVSSADELEIEYSNDMPLKIGFETGGGKLEYYLAPRIEGNE